MVRDMLGEEAEWSLDTHLLAFIADGIWAGVWQRGSGKKKDKPKPIPRPGDKKPKALGTVSTFDAIDAMRKRIRRG